MRGNDDLFGYAEHTGLLHHREMGAYWARKFGLDVASGEQMVLVNGAQHALSALIECYTQPGIVLL